jgi:tetratricopeptide (TPR) repeat protein
LDLTNPRDAVALARLVDWLPEVGRAPEAVELARKARDARPEVSIFQALYAQALEGAGEDADDARASFEKALELDETNTVALRGLAAFLAARDEDEARVVELYEKAIELDPNDDRDSKKLAAFLQTRGREGEAIEVLANLLERQPWDADASLTMATALLDEDAAANRARAAQRVDLAHRLGKGSKEIELRLDQLTSRLAAVPQADSS